jgi:hypothetical protein
MLTRCRRNLAELNMENTITEPCRAEPSRRGKLSHVCTRLNLTSSRHDLRLSIYFFIGTISSLIFQMHAHFMIVTNGRSRWTNFLTCQLAQIYGRDVKDHDVACKLNDTQYILFKHKIMIDLKQHAYTDDPCPISEGGRGPPCLMLVVVASCKKTPTGKRMTWWMP